MKLLQKSTLCLIIGIVFFDLLSQLSELIYYFSLEAPTTIQLINRIAFPIAFSLGCLIANYNLFRHSKLVSIIFGCYFVSLILGGYLYITDLVVLSILRVIHGYFLSLIFCKSFSMLNYLTPRLIFKDTLRKFGLFLTAATILLLSTSSLITEVFGIQWFYLISMFVYFFCGTLMLLLFNFFKETGKMKSRITLFDFKHAIITSKISINLVTIFITMLSLGSLVYWTMISPSKSEDIMTSKHILLSAMLAAICLVFISRLSLAAEAIGHIKAYTTGFLIIALALSSIAILDGYILLNLSYIMMGIGLGLLISSGYQALKENTSYPTADVAFGIFHSLMVSGILCGIFISRLLSIYRHSSIIFTSLVIICCSIFYIRQIQHSTTGTTISG